MRGLVVGRFQPLHRGHTVLIQTAIEDCVNVVVGIGSAQAKQDMRNPFSYDERVAMIRAVFGDRVTIKALPDIQDPPRWVDHVLSVTGAVEKVYGNNDRDLDLFEEEGLTTVRPGLVDRERFKATNVRMRIAEDDADWRKDVPPEVVAVLDRIDAGKRLRLLEARL